MTELKQCPFCGSEAKLISRGSCNYVTCSNEDECWCGMTCPVSTPEEAVRIWNRRTTEKELVANIVIDEEQLKRMCDEAVSTIIDCVELLAVADECDASDMDTDWAARIRKAVGA